jgi:hypothetical protein
MSRPTVGAENELRSALVPHRRQRELAILLVRRVRRDHVGERREQQETTISEPGERLGSAHTSARSAQRPRHRRDGFRRERGGFAHLRPRRCLPLGMGKRLISA